MSRIFKTIGTHSGTFHCDEALAIAMLRVLNNFKDAEVIRSRDMDVLEKLDILVDVGSVCDPTTYRFDHHQRGFTETFSASHDIKLSSAGLVYKYFGKDILSTMTQISNPDTLTVLHEKIYESFIKGVDAIDNGISQYPPELEPTYSNSTDLGSRVGRLNPDWNEDINDEELFTRFMKASDICAVEFNDIVSQTVKSWLPSRDISLAAFNARFNPNDVDSQPTGEYVVFDQFCPWKDHFFTAQAAEPADLPIEQSLRNVKYIIYLAGNQWRYLAVPIHKSSFVSRLPFPESWRGLRDAELDAASGIDGCTFVHHSGFTGGNKTKRGLIEMIKVSLEQQNSKKQKTE